MRSACLAVLMLLATLAAAHAQPAAGDRSFSLEGGVGLLGSVATGGFSDRVDGAYGGGGYLDVSLGRTIFSLGGELSGAIYGDESRNVYVGDVIPDLPGVSLKVDTTNTMWMLHGRLTAQRRSGRWRPYATGVIGATHLSTTTSINGALSCTGGGYAPYFTCSSEQAAEVTHASDTVLSYGGGGGVKVAFSQKPMVPKLDLSVRYHRGGEATYLTEGAISREDGHATYLFSHSHTDMVVFYIGIAVTR